MKNFIHPVINETWEEARNPCGYCDHRFMGVCTDLQKPKEAPVSCDTVCSLFNQEDFFQNLESMENVALQDAFFNRFIRRFALSVEFRAQEIEHNLFDQARKKIKQKEEIVGKFIELTHERYSDFTEFVLEKSLKSRDELNTDLFMNMAVIAKDLIELIKLRNNMGDYSSS